MAASESVVPRPLERRAGVAGAALAAVALAAVAAVDATDGADGWTTPGTLACAATVALTRASLTL